VTRRRISAPLVRDTPVLRPDDAVEDAVRVMLESGLPALPVVDEKSHLVGVFGEREFMAALFPGYVGELRFAGFVRKGFDETLETRDATCRREPVRKFMTTDHVEVDVDASDVQVAETFLHHRVLIVPVCENKRVTGVITRSDFFRKLAERLLEHR
jgi:CBS domain-containing protein